MKKCIKQQPKLFFCAERICERRVAAGPLAWAMFGLIPEHAMCEKDLERQMGVDTLVGSQERRAAVFPRTNRLSTGRQPRVLFLRRFT